MSNGHRPTDEPRNATHSAATDGTRDEVHAGGGSLIADGGAPISDLLEALASDRRRYVLYYLRHEGDARLEAVIERIGAWERVVPPEELDDGTKRDIRIDLYHTHLPKLEAAGIIQYDRLSGHVGLRDPPDPVEQFLDYCATIESPEAIG